MPNAYILWSDPCSAFNLNLPILSCSWQLTNARRDLADVERRGADLDAANKELHKRIVLDEDEQAASEYLTHM